MLTQSSTRVKRTQRVTTGQVELESSSSPTFWHTLSNLDDYDGKSLGNLFKLTHSYVHTDPSLALSHTALPLAVAAACFRHASYTGKLVEWSLSAPLVHMGFLLIIKYTALTASVLRLFCKKLYSNCLYQHFFLPLSNFIPCFPI